MNPWNEKEFECPLCGIIFNSSISNLRRHVRLRHKTELPSSKKSLIKCPDENCQESCRTIKILSEHIRDVHKVEIEEEVLTFKSLADFQEWKKSIENDTLSLFTKYGGSSPNFYCHRSGFFRSKSTGKRNVKHIGSRKLNGWCPASMQLKTVGDEFKLFFRKTHFGHDFNYEHFVRPGSLMDNPEERKKRHRIIDRIRRLKEKSKSLNGKSSRFNEDGQIIKKNKGPTISALLKEKEEKTNSKEVLSGQEKQLSYFNEPFEHNEDLSDCGALSEFMELTNNPSESEPDMVSKASQTTFDMPLEDVKVSYLRSTPSEPVETRIVDTSSIPPEVLYDSNMINDNEDLSDCGALSELMEMTNNSSEPDMLSKANETTFDSPLKHVQVSHLSGTPSEPVKTRIVDTSSIPPEVLYDGNMINVNIDGQNVPCMIVPTSTASQTGCYVFFPSKKQNENLAPANSVEDLSSPIPCMEKISSDQVLNSGAIVPSSLLTKSSNVLINKIEEMFFAHNFLIENNISNFLKQYKMFTKAENDSPLGLNHCSRLKSIFDNYKKMRNDIKQQLMEVLTPDTIL